VDAMKENISWDGLMITWGHGLWDAHFCFGVLTFWYNRSIVSLWERNVVLRVRHDVKWEWVENRKKRQRKRKSDFGVNIPFGATNRSYNCNSAIKAESLYTWYQAYDI
jgi:hypothetical protein